MPSHRRQPHSGTSLYFRPTTLAVDRNLKKRALNECKLLLITVFVKPQGSDADRSEALEKEHRREPTTCDLIP